MEFITLGNTGLKASVAGLGCGGGSKLGLTRGLTRQQSVKLVHLAMDPGVN